MHATMKEVLRQLGIPEGRQLVKRAAPKVTRVKRLSVSELRAPFYGPSVPIRSP